MRHKHAAKKDCPRCRRTRWLLTILTLVTMSLVLYLDQQGLTQSLR